ncbi:MAG: dTMP kinase [Deltaproteobacteria bacterium]|nr:dTMP kinase [Deltaproteobacteria bacterium]
MGAPFITFEGIEGSGKSTQVRLLSDHLASRNIPHAVTREPGGTPLAESVRALLLSHRDGEIIFPETELLLYEAARAQHVRIVVRPALDAGKAVLCDRFCDATLAYQGHARRLPAAWIEELNAYAAGGLVPDLTVLLDLSPEEGFARLAARGGGRDRLEGESLKFHRLVREGYLLLQARHPGRIVRVDGAPPPDRVFSEVREAVASRFGW